MAIAGLGQALGIIGQGVQQKAQLDWQEQRQANLERIRQQERGEDKAVRASEFEETKKFQRDSLEATTKYHGDSLLQQAARDKASAASDAARTAIAQEGLNLQKKSADYQMFSQALAGASDTIATLKRKEAEILSQQPRVNKDGEQVEDIVSFKARSSAALSQVRAAIKEEQPKFQKEIERVRKNFPQFENVMPSIEELAAPSAGLGAQQESLTDEQKFLQSPEQVAKRKAAQAAADTGTSQPQQPLINRAAGVPVTIRGAIADPEPSPRNPQAWREWRDRRDALELKGASLLQRPFMASGRGG